MWFKSFVGAFMQSSAARLPWRRIYNGIGGRARRRTRAVSKTPTHGHSSGVRNVGRPDRLTRRPGTQTMQRRTLRATVSWSLGVISPSNAVQRIRSWASTAHKSQVATRPTRLARTLGT